MQTTRRSCSPILLLNLGGLLLFFPNPLSAQSGYEKAVLAKKPVGYWRLSEEKGSIAKDSSKNRHNGKYFGTPFFQEPGAIKEKNTTVKLDGRKSYIEVPAHRDFSPSTSGKGLTVEVWFRPDRLEFQGETDDPYIFWLGKGEPKQHEWAFRFYSKTSKDRPNRISAYIFNPDGGLSPMHVSLMARSASWFPKRERALSTGTGG